MTKGENTAGPGRGFTAGASIIALIGLVDAGYLTSKHLSGTKVPCSILAGCETVLSSQWAEIFGLPTALYGAVAYFIAFALAYLVYSGRNELWPLFGTLAFLMFVGSLFFLYLQAFVIGAFCQYCLVSAVTSTLLFFVYLSSYIVARRGV